MAKRVTVADLQAMQRGGNLDSNGDEQIDPVAQDALAAEALRRIGAPINGRHQEVQASGQAESSGSAATNEVADEAPVGPTPDAMTRLVAREMSLLNVEAQCTAEMSLSMIVDRVREAVVATDWGKLATDAEIVHEAERIWSGFEANRSGPREYDVIDGEVRDWRRPDTTPDRGDVTEVHTVTDDEPRFSGSGDGQADEQSSLIPADKDFGGKPFREASELASLADELIEKHGYLDHLEHCTIRYFWRRKTGVSKGQRITGGLDRGSGLKGFLLGTDFAIWLAADTARERRFSERRVSRHLFRQLRRIGQDDKGNWIELPFTLQIFTEEILEYADVGDDDLRIGHGAFRNADQMGLFDVDDEGIEDDDDAEELQENRPRDPFMGAGTLIHADGTALTDDEIEALEAAELADDEYPNLTAQMAKDPDLTDDEHSLAAGLI